MEITITSRLFPYNNSQVQVSMFVGSLPSTSRNKRVFLRVKKWRTFHYADVYFVQDKLQISIKLPVHLQVLSRFSIFLLQFKEILLRSNGASDHPVNVGVCEIECLSHLINCRHIQRVTCFLFIEAAFRNPRRGKRFR